MASAMRGSPFGSLTERVRRMAMQHTWRPLRVALTGSLIALLTGCGASATINTPAALSGRTDDAGCQPYHSFGRFPGRTVSVLAGFLAPDDRAYTQSFATFERCTGITVRYEGSSQLEAELKIRIDSGDAPDLAFIPQPGLLEALVTGGSVK